MTLFTRYRSHCVKHIGQGILHAQIYGHSCTLSVDRGRNVHRKAEKIDRYDPTEHDGTTMKTIAYFESCFSCRNGAPRQGSLVPSSRGKLKLLSQHFDGRAGHAFDGLQDFSHVWLIWMFQNQQ